MEASRPEQCPPDQAQRDLVVSALESNMLVEAAAGTGKTTCMIERMTALLRTGACDAIRQMAAVTFTRKAAAELRGRFQVQLERALCATAVGHERERLERALEQMEQCFIGTIHSFCGRLLRERPVEARLDLGFEEIDEEADARLRKEAWDLYAAGTLGRDGGDGGGAFMDFERHGLSPGDLEDTFIERYAEYPDVDEWPVPETTDVLPGLDDTVRRVQVYVAHMRALAPRLPRDWGNDTLIPEYLRLPRRVAHCEDISDPRSLMELLEGFARKRKAVQQVWIDGGDGLDREDARREQARWDSFREDVAVPLLEAWYEKRYVPVLRVLEEARWVYDDLRRQRGALNFQDLLMKAAGLLRDQPSVRAYFQERYRFLLVDEFQDTDPVQAEVMLLLTAENAGETRWRRCRPRPGSLFVVGDPKQSIYRFRRADIVTYNEVKEIIRRGNGGDRPGQVVGLTANFRSSCPVLEWVNRVFGPEPGSGDALQRKPSGQGPMLRFPSEPSKESPAYVPLANGRQDGTPGKLGGVYSLTVPEARGNKDEAVAYEADRIARTIRHALDSGVTVTRALRHEQEGRSAAVCPCDFLIVTRNTARLGVYARSLQAYDIPHQVTGGASLNEVEELPLLHLCLQAVLHPDNPVALLAVLRSDLFGMSDRALYAFKKAGGSFSYRAEVPRRLAGEGGQDGLPGRAFCDAFHRLQRYEGWLFRFPPIVAVEKIAGDLGLFARAAARAGGEVDAGSLAKALEILRSARRDAWTVAQAVDFLGRLATGEEKHDGISARSLKRDVVRVMNLHKAKGLEAAVVFLADPVGEFAHPVELCIDRSGDSVRGYMAVFGRRGEHQKPVLARPGGWEAWSETERRFADAEELRLRYVAATRAGAALIITQRIGKGNPNRFNPWGHFGEFIPAGSELPDPGMPSVRLEARAPLARGEAEGAESSIASRKGDVMGPTYEAIGAKLHALGPVPAMPGSAAPITGESMGEGEHGLEWGSVIHGMLETAMGNPVADLRRSAEALLPEHGLDGGRAGEAADLVRTVIDSGIWSRALAGSACFTEIPFQFMQGGGAGRPVLIRGSIDLVFKELDGWVLVDYKTDRFRGRAPETLAAHYAPQLRLYAEAWEQATGERPKEMALFFVHEDCYVRVDTSGWRE